MIGKVAKVAALSLLFLTPMLLVVDGSEEASTRFELCGILNFGAEGVFNLRDRENNTVRWVELGRSMNGYRIEEYDSNSKTLTLISGDNEVLKVSLEKESFPVGVISEAHIGSAGASAAKRPPRPEIPEVSSSKPDSPVGVLNRNRRTITSRSTGVSTSAQSRRTNPEDGEGPRMSGEEAVRGKNHSRGQLAYDLKVRPPMRIESTGLRTKNAE